MNTTPVWLLISAAIIVVLLLVIARRLWKLTLQMDELIGEMHPATKQKREEEWREQRFRQAGLQ